MLLCEVASVELPHNSWSILQASFFNSSIGSLNHSGAAVSEKEFKNNNKTAPHTKSFTNLKTGMCCVPA